MARITTPLTNTEIKAAKPAEKEYTLQDGDGLYLLVKPSGSKIWRFNYYLPPRYKETCINQLWFIPCGFFGRSPTTA